MYKSEDAKREYFRTRYQNNKERYAKANDRYWIKYAKEKLNKEDVTEEEVKLCRNEYYRQYRKNNKESIQKNMEDFWKRKVEERNEIQE